MIKSIELINFLSHRNTKIDLTDGVNVFVGQNGSGKSSIVDAVTFALFGEHNRNKNKNLIKRGENNAAVKVIFTLHGKEYEVTRSIDTKNKLLTTLHDITDGKRQSIAAGERKQFGESTTREIEKRIGLDYDKLKIASIVSQGELNTIIDAKPKEFKELLNAIIGINLLDIASQQLSIAMGKFNEKIRDNIGYVHTDTPRLKKEQKSKNDELDQSRSKIQELEDNKNMIIKETEKIEDDININVHKQDQIKVLDQRRQELESYVQQKRLEIQNDIDRLKRHKEELELERQQRLQEIQNDIDRLKRHKEELELERQQRLQEIQNDIDRLKRHKEELELERQQRLQEIQNDIDRLKRHKEELELERQQRLQEIQNDIDRLKRHKEELELAERQRVKNLDEQIQILNQRINEIESSDKQQRDDLRREIDENKLKIRDCQELLSRIDNGDDLESEINNNDKEITVLTEIIQTHRDNIMSHSEQLDLANKLQLKDGTCPVCNSVVDKLNPLFDEHHIESEITKAKQSITTSEDKLKELEIKRKNLAEKSQQIENARAALAAHKISSIDDLNVLQSDIAAKTKQLDTVDTQKIDEIQSDIAAKTKQLDTVDTQKIDEIQSDIAAKTKQLDTVDTQKIDEIQSDIAAKTKQLDTVDTQKIDEIQSDIAAKTKQLDTVDTQKIDEIQSDIAAKTKQLDTVDTQKIDEIQSDIAAKTKQLTGDYMQEIIEMDQHAKQLSNDIKRLEDDTRGFSVEKLTELRDSLESKRIKLTKMDGLIGATNEKIRAANEWITSIKPILAELEIVQNYIEQLEDIGNRVYARDGPVAQSLRSWALENISVKSSEYLELLNTKISRVLLSEKARNVSIACYVEGQTLDLATLSGGEQVSVALALRLGMSSLLGSSGLNLMILDEPTTHLDSERKRSLVGVLGELANVSSRETTQFIIITHDIEIFEDSNVEQIYKFEFAHGKSIVSSP